MSPKKILILRFSSIGDIVLTTPVPRTLKTQLDDAEIHFCTKKQFAGILEENPYIDKVHTLGNRLGDLVNELKKEKFDYVVDLHNNLRTMIIKARLGVKSSTFDKLNLKKWLYVHLKMDVMPNRHIVDRYMDAVQPLGVKMDTLGLDYFIPENDVYDPKWLPESHRKEFVAVVVGASFSTKRLPTEKLIQLCDQIAKPIVLLGGKEDVEVGEQIEAFFKAELDKQKEDTLAELGKKTQIFNACGKFNLHRSAALVKASRCVFTHDTGLMHIAAAFKKEIYSIWGNTTPELGMYPYRTKFTVFEVKGLNCRPCSKLGYNECPKGHFRCMKDQKFDFYLP
ncbi:glycosyl hydrolase [Fulvitalea axinellae]|uniref:Glycosyl hydrolase n=1 Tax=Fulvitalea axinellae TaxID=1182444 RepID=A0AAU9CRI7_9BACT|nr:glycosyl hydrolase [Fulvitalea axinellae]